MILDLVILDLASGNRSKKGFNICDDITGMIEKHVINVYMGSVLENKTIAMQILCGLLTHE